MVAAAELVPDILPAISLSPDPDDNLTIATAVAGEADLLVTREKSDLIALSVVHGIPICTPRDALEQIQIT
jgi:predicted nucleic acid-binding protein